MVASHVHGSASTETVVASIDSDTGGDEYVIADISTDDAWLSMAADAAPTLDSWR
ncbi:DUF7556 family protein [Halovivax limisalsi]|uniref:DUF7556 family protein n=1 Tax=Halovivax limisalsi TaxID=1453760 RepID=UPI001FFD4E5E|nr:hypothetical protein [Halovivax limisalsi]